MVDVIHGSLKQIINDTPCVHVDENIQNVEMAQIVDKDNLVSLPSKYKPLTNYTIRRAVDDYCSGNQTLIENVKKIYGDIGEWDTTEVTDMRELFRYKYTFNGNISGWNVSNVTDMDEMFFGAYLFNSNISNWNVSKLQTARLMFCKAYSFNVDLNNWDVSNVKDMYSMFSHTKSFNGNICNWNVSNCKNMAYMFSAAESFKQNLSAWNISRTHIDYMFSYECELTREDVLQWTNADFIRNIKTIFKICHSSY